MHKLRDSGPDPGQFVELGRKGGLKIFCGEETSKGGSSPLNPMLATPLDEAGGGRLDVTFSLVV